LNSETIGEEFLSKFDDKLNDFEYLTEIQSFNFQIDKDFNPDEILDY
jgi:hypothetical protein